MPDDYYQNTLYPLQDKVLDIVASTTFSFYLTGGTALSRAYLHHRFSDDLDFFVNRSQQYQEQVEGAYQALKSANFEETERAVSQSDFTRLYVRNKTGTLKVDFVNDIDFRVGRVTETPLFIRTDTMRNILSNKLSALGRLEAKDVIDIIYITQKLAFNWKEIIGEAQQKDMWVDPVEIVDLLEQFPIAKLASISWTKGQPNKDWIQSCLQSIKNDILTGSDNSFVN